MGSILHNDQIGLVPNPVIGPARKADSAKKVSTSVIPGFGFRHSKQGSSPMWFCSSLDSTPVRHLVNFEKWAFFVCATFPTTYAAIPDHVLRHKKTLVIVFAVTRKQDYDTASHRQSRGIYQVGHCSGYHDTTNSMPSMFAWKYIVPVDIYQISRAAVSRMIASHIMKTTLKRRSQTIDKKLGSKWSVLTQYDFWSDSNLLLITPESCASKTVVYRHVHQVMISTPDHTRSATTCFQRAPPSNIRSSILACDDTC